MIATGIDPMEIEIAWHVLWPFLERALRHSDEQPTPAEILTSIRGKRLTAWLVYEKNCAVAGICVKKLYDQTSGESRAHLWLIGGSRLHCWAPDFLSKFIPWARAEKCCAVTASGRLGWSRWAGRYGFARVADLDGLPCWRRDI